MITGGCYEPFETINTTNYIQLIQTYKDKQPGLISNFISAYVLYNKDKTYNEYLQTYKTSKQNLDNQNAEMFASINTLETNINKLNMEIQSMDTTITSSLGANTQIAKKISNLDSSNNSSQILIDNSKELYKDQYINNISQLLGICLLSFFIFSIFKKPKIT